MPYEKMCSSCLQSLSIFNFNTSKTSKDGLNGRCKFCISDYNKKYKKSKSNKEKTNTYNIKNNLDSKANKKEYDKEYRIKNKDKIKERLKLYAELNKDIINIRAQKWKRFRRATDPKFKINNAMSCSIRDGLNKAKSGKSWTKIVDYTVDELIVHLESKFINGMTWENYGKNGWEIDHIIPVSLFKFDSYNHPAFKACWALENLQPLWRMDNLNKSNKIELTPEIKELLDRVNV